MKFTNGTVFLLVYGGICFLLVAIANVFLSKHQHYRYLAEAFLQGKTYFLISPVTWGDTSPYGSHYYWPLGPVPALVLVPFVIVWRMAGYTFYQGYLSLALTLGIAYDCFRIAEMLRYSKNDAILLAFAFCCSTSFLAVAAISWSWYFAHVVGVGLLLIAIREFIGRRRWWLMGSALGLAMATRLPLGLSILFFAVSGYHSQRNLRSLIELLLPFGMVALLLGAYNFARFDSFFEPGYSYQMHNEPELGLGAHALSLGNFIAHLPRFLIGAPIITRSFPFISPDHLGMSIFMVSPFLIYLASLRKFDSTAILLVFNIIIIAFAVLAWRSTGYRQVGYRFSLDLMPLLFFLLMRNGFGAQRMLSIGFKRLVILGSLGNLFLTAIFVMQVH